MSTILDALRKAQDETGEPRKTRIAPLPGDPKPPRRERSRRGLFWLLTALGILVVAFAGGLALGDRLGSLFGGGADDVAQVSATTAGVSDDGAAGQPAVASAPAQPEPAPAAAEPRRARPRRAGKPANAGEGAEEKVREGPRVEERVAALHPEGGQPRAHEDAAPQPTPAGQLQVLEAKPNGAPAGGDRAERLKELRERMLEARRDAQARAASRPAKAPPVPIIVPGADKPAGEAAPAKPASAAPAKPVEKDLAIGRRTEEEHAAEVDAEPAAAPPPSVPAAAPPAPVLAAQPPPPVPAPAADAPVIDQQTLAALAAHGRGDAAAPPDGGAPGGAARDATAPPSDAAPAAAAAEPARDAAGGEGDDVKLAAVKPQPPAPRTQPPVLRRPPGGAPQVAINILQWSAEPGRRFAFVTVDGGNMTQIREGDRIGGLTVKRIYEQMIEFGFNDSSFMLRAN